MNAFENQKVLITGGTRGIGRGIAEAFLRQGAHVIVTYLGNEEAARTFQEANGHYAEKIDVYKVDSACKDQVVALFQKIEAKHGELHVLVNNSGIRKDALLATMAEEDWHHVLNTNLTGTFLMCQQAVLLFLKRRYGRIVNISSIGGQIGLPGQTNYAATKAGQLALAKSLSKEVAKKGITVNCVAPGFIDTELIKDLPEEQLKEYKQQVPMRRFGKIEEVAHGVLFLAHANSSYITGTSLEITGGLN